VSEREAPPPVGPKEGPGVRDLEALQERYGPPQPRDPLPGQQAFDLPGVGPVPERERDGAPPRGRARRMRRKGRER
jgi:hypothetical protein